jgi:hypothetical protein
MLAHPVQYVVAGDHRHAQTGQLQLARNLQHRLAGCQRIGRAHIRNDGSALLDAGRQDRVHALLQQGVVTELRIAAAPQLRQRDRAFGQALEHQRIEFTALGQFLRGVNAVAGIAGSGADPKWFHASDYSPDDCRAAAARFAEPPCIGDALRVMRCRS